MNIFHDNLRKFVLVFFDNILVYSRSISDRQQHLVIMFQTLAAHQLYANHKKCQFGQEELEYLGHIISKDGVAANGATIAAMLHGPLLALSGSFGDFLPLLDITSALWQDIVTWRGHLLSSLNGIDFVGC